MFTNKEILTQIEPELQDSEDILLTISGKTAPTNLFMKLLPEVSWMTKENMPIVFVLTNQRVLIFKNSLNQSITLSFSLLRSDISSISDVSGPLNGGLQIHVKENQSYRFVFKKHRIHEILEHFQEK